MTENIYYLLKISSLLTEKEILTEKNTYLIKISSLLPEKKYLKEMFSSLLKFSSQLPEKKYLTEKFSSLLSGKKYLKCLECIQSKTHDQVKDCKTIKNWSHMDLTPQINGLIPQIDGRTPQMGKAGRVKKSQSKSQIHSKQ